MAVARTNQGEGENLSPAQSCCPKMETAGGLEESHNSNVLNILTLTTLRTIDLGGKKIFDPLFSIF
jgi:hypothetical protein